MITITRSMARQLRAVLRRAGLTKGRHGNPAALRFNANADGLTLAASRIDVAIEYRHPGQFPVSQFALPMDVLAVVEGRDDGLVTFTPSDTGSTVTVRWTDRGVAKEQVFETLILADLPPVPGLPERWADNDASLITALNDAMATRDAESTRFALGCVQVGGADGEIAATDSRQLLIQRGYRFPWQEELLFTGTDVFAARELLGHDTVRIGRSERGVAVQAGPWTVYLQLGTGRFPDVRRIIPAKSAVATTLQITPADAEFLTQSLGGLPCDDSLSQPITLDLNGAVAIRARSGAESAVSELVLSNSTRTGDDLRMHLNRQYLARAVELGFRELQFVNGEAPVVCREQQRTYLWAPLDKDSMIPATEHALRSCSPVKGVPSTPSAPRPVNRIAERLPKRTRHSSATPPTRRLRKTTAPGSPDVIARTLELRSQLRSVLQGLGDLVRQIRQQRKQSRLAKSTLAALKQLQTLNV
jgi:hypothetical protein